MTESVILEMSVLPKNSSETLRKSEHLLPNWFLLLLLTALAFALMGYHPGLEDDAF